MTERDRERGEGPDPIDEEAAWAEIVAGYGEQPAPPPGVWHPDAVPDRKDGGTGSGEAASGDGRDAEQHRGENGEEHGDNGAWSGPGPRDWAPEEDEDEGHFVPPDPPPPPQADMATKLAWLGALGGPVLLVLAAVLGWEVSWWLATAAIGGFLGGLATLVTRLRDGRDDEWTDPGGGAVV